VTSPGTDPSSSSIPSLAGMADLLDLAQAQAGAVELRPERHDLHAILTGVVESFRAKATAEGVALSIALDPELPREGIFDARIVERTVGVLVSGSIVAPRGSTVHLSARRTSEGDDLASVVVTVFPPMYGGSGSPRVELAANDPVGWSLATTYAGLLDGALEWFFEPFDRSSTTILTARVLRQPKPEPRTTPVHVLIADDHVVNGLLVEALLVKIGCTVTVTTDGAQAVAAFAARRPDFVLMDVQMPVMDGLEATRKIRASEGTGPRVTIYALTAGTSARELAECRAAGMDDFVHKPANLESLTDAVAAFETKRPLVKVAAVNPEAAPPQDPSKRRAIAVDRLRQRCDGDDDLVEVVMDAFKGSFKGSVQSLLDALKKRDLPVVATAAHRLRGALNTVAAEHAGAITKRLEEAAGSGDEAALVAIEAELDSEIALIEAELAA
jgi:CheY-like chemotaxis protein